MEIVVSRRGEGQVEKPKLRQGVGVVLGEELGPSSKKSGNLFG
jgi:hypothetical protein